MRAFFLALTLLGLAACGESQQVVVYKQGKYQGKPDSRPWDNEPVGGWDKDPADLNLWIARGMPRDTGGYPTDD